ncbi:MAG: hypothetical protein LBS06_04490 [Treponema sp.]|nr:hypothetical protein [Treponema sp.]
MKILYEQDAGEIKVKICKVCKAAIKHGKKSVIHTGPQTAAQAAAAN